jgi:hypothetical protein
LPECELLLYPLGFKDIAVSFKRRPLFTEYYVTDSDRLNPVFLHSGGIEIFPQAALIFSQRALNILKQCKFHEHQRALNAADSVIASRAYQGKQLTERKAFITELLDISL